MYEASDYGVVGDGVTDDTAAINTAISTVSAASSATNRGRLVFDDGVYMTDGIVVKPNVWLDFGNAYFKKRGNGASVATNSLMRATPALVEGSYYGTYKNIKITGGTFDSNGFTCPACIVNLIFCEDLELEGMTAIHSPENDNWAFEIGGRRINARNMKVLGGTDLFQDGLHILHGQYINVDGLYAESGDDALAIGGEPSITQLNSDPDPIRYVNARNICVKANKGAAVKVYVQSGATGPGWEVTDINIDGVSGESGITRNGGLTIIDLNGGVAGSTQIKRVSVTNTKLKVGSSGHDGVNAYGIWAKSVTDLTVEASMDLHSGITPGMLMDADITRLQYTTERGAPSRTRCTGHG